MLRVSDIWLDAPKDTKRESSLAKTELVETQHVIEYLSQSVHDLQQQEHVETSKEIPEANNDLLDMLQGGPKGEFQEKMENPFHDIGLVNHAIGGGLEENSLA